MVAIAACIFLTLASAQFGFSRLLGRYGVTAMSFPATAEAIRLSPYDADAHRAQAVVFRNFQMYAEARRELEIAASLRPHDDYLWLDLGVLRDEVGDTQAALTSFDQAVANAPFYAHTRWQRANLRLRLGRYDEAFPELREAAASNPNFLPVLIDLAWNLSRYDAKSTEQLAGIQSTTSRIEFVRFLARKGRGKETLEQFRLIANEMSPEYKNDLVRQLIATDEVEAAFEIWCDANGVKNSDGPFVYDGGFEGPVSFSEAGFGWRISQEAKLEVSQDVSERDSGVKSLRIAFNGNSFSPNAFLSQIIIVRAEQKYRINFATKSKSLVTASPLIFRVSSAAPDKQTLKEFEIASETEWRRQSFEFTTPIKCRSVELKLLRKQCASSPCQIFGFLWLDSFSIEQLPQ
jgi:hypothetical protein